MTSVIKRIVKESEYGGQTIKMVVRANERGPKGDKGDKGDAATIAAGQAYPVPEDSQPAVMNVGTENNAIFDFYLPKGPKGDKGDKGDDGMVQYTAGRGIRIVDNVISATGGGGGGGGAWGEIIGDIADQTDLQEEFAQYTKTADLASVATSGSYNDLSSKPDIPAAQVQSDWAQSDNTQVDFIKNKPTISTVNNATLTIKRNNTTVATFTANSSTDTVADITTPIIDLTDTDPGEGSVLDPDNFVAVYGGNPIILDYSTSETNTGTKWINGAIIYKKTISLGSLPNNTTKTVSHGINNLVTLVKLEGAASDNNIFSATQIPLPFVTNNDANQIYITINSTDITVGTATDRSSLSGYVTLYYTKS